MQDLQQKIEAIVSGDLDLNSSSAEKAITECIEGLDSGKFRVCEKHEGQWQTHAWLKQAILLYFKTQPMRSFSSGDLNFYDKIPLKSWSANEGVRVVPHAVVRKGAHIAKGAILMPSYVNIGAFVDSGSMVDTWATVGSCAQIGKNVHLSGGVGIGGVLEPVQASPVIIEDEAFIGSRCIVVEGAIVESGAVLGAGVTVTATSRVIDVTSAEEKVFRGRIPKNAIVVPGSSPKSFPAGNYNINSALIIGYRSPDTDKKTSLTAALRDFEVSV